MLIFLALRLIQVQVGHEGDSSTAIYNALSHERSNGDEHAGQRSPHNAAPAHVNHGEENRWTGTG
jgi:hypothetical protein